MKKTLFNKLKKYERLLTNVHYSRVLFNAKACYLNAIADAVEIETDITVKRQWSCAQCAFNFLDGVARDYFAAKAEIEETTTTTKAGKKKESKKNEKTKTNKNKH